jgi:hypothetical protein
MAEEMRYFEPSSVSCADLIRASIQFREVHLARKMDCRVKPGNDKHSNAT